MKFLFRSVIVLLVAVVFGVVLFYAVRVLPTDSSNPPAEIQNPSNTGNSTSPLPTSIPENPKRDRAVNPLRSILRLGWRVVLFSIMVFFAEIAKNSIFERKPARQKSPD